MLLRRHKLARMKKQAAEKPSADSVSKASKTTKKDTKAATDKEKKGGAKSGSNDD